MRILSVALRIASPSEKDACRPCSKIFKALQDIHSLIHLKAAEKKVFKRSCSVGYKNETICGKLIRADCIVLKFCPVPSVMERKPVKADVYWLAESMPDSLRRQSPQRPLSLQLL